MDQSSQAVVAEAGITAALEPSRRRFFSRRRKTQPPPLPYCENCGATMIGPFCAKCGQHAIDYRRSFGRVFLDVLDSFLNWDSKFFLSAGLLVTRPWQLTIDFLSGKRVRYVHPLRLYLLVSIIFFFGVHELARRADIHPGRKHPLTAAEHARIEQKIATLPADTQAEIRAALSAPSEEMSSLEVGAGPSSHRSSPLAKWISAKVKEKIGENGVNLKVFFLTVVSNLPAMMLCCIPLFAFVLKILYLGRRFFYIDHLIYALHIHAFAYVVIMIVGFTSWELARITPAVQPFVTAALVVAAIMLLLFSIRRVYRQNWFITLFKFWFGGAVYLVVLWLALAATFFATLALPS